MKNKKIPLRTCVVTKEKLEKKDLIRVVKNNENEVFVDLTGKANGRGAYIKKDIDVLNKARKSKVLEAGNYRSYYLVEDYDMWIRMIEHEARCYNFQEILVFMRVSTNFYKRRGGLKYLKSILKFKKEQLQNGFYSKKDFVISSCAHIIMCLMPNQIRDLLYRKILRKKQNKKGRIHEKENKCNYTT